MKNRVLSGMRPTGPMHLGHLVGALKNWIELQDEYECFYMVADWHALMSEYEDTQHIQGYIRHMVADWLACRIDPEKSTIFIQSHIPEHLELAMILSCLTPLSWLERCPTYKEQLREMKTRDLTTYGFLGYPVLQAADILIYKATHVPVGEDQLAHLELTREMARRFNSFYGKLLVEPDAILTKTPRLLGTDNRKMSKSYDNFIALSEDPKIIEKKVAKMVTDPQRIKRTDKGHPDRCNVFEYYHAYFGPSRVLAGWVSEGGGLTEMEKSARLRERCINAEAGCVKCKEELAKLIADLLRPIREKSQSLLAKKETIDDILIEGAQKARKIASKTLLEIKEKIKLR